MSLNCGNSCDRTELREMLTIKSIKCTGLGTEQSGGIGRIKKTRKTEYSS